MQTKFKKAIHEIWKTCSLLGKNLLILLIMSYYVDIYLL